MYDDIRDILPEQLSDDAASKLVGFLYELASTVEGVYLSQIMRYKKNCNQQFDDIPDPPF